jgi:hypothetical protein
MLLIIDVAICQWTVAFGPLVAFTEFACVRLAQWVFWGSVVRFQKITKIAKRWNCLAFLPTMAGTDDPHWRHHHPVVAAGDTTNEGIDPPDGAPEGKDQLTVHQRTERGTKKK